MCTWGSLVLICDFYDTCISYPHVFNVICSFLFTLCRQYTWDTPVREILGNDFYFFDGLRTNQTTLRDLASHATGIYRNDFLMFHENVRDQLEEYVIDSLI